MTNNKPELIRQTAEKQEAQKKQEIIFKEERKKSAVFQKIKDNIYAFLENYVFVGFMTLITIYALFGDDIRQLATSKSGDNGFYATTAVCLGIFVLEILLSCIAKPDYIFGYFFWLDLISTVSLIFDIGWINDAIFGTDSVRLVKIYKLKQDLEDAKAKDDDFQFDDDVIEEDEEPQTQAEKNENHGSLTQTPEDNQVKKASTLESDTKKESLEKLKERKASIKRFSTQKSRKSIRGLTKDLSKVHPAARGDDEEYVETNVGKKLSDLTTRRVIALVLSVMISIPLFTANTYKTDYTSYEYGLNTLYAAWSSSWTTPSQYSAIFNTTRNTYVSMGTAARLPLVKLDSKTANLFTDSNVNLDEIRSGDLQYFVGGYDSTGNPNFFAVYNQASDNNLGAILSIIRTLFVSVVLTGGALLFSKDASNLVVQPIEQMLKRVKRIASNPLKAVQMEEKEALLADKLEQQNKGKKSKDMTENFETAILERTIVKIGALLALGFGEAGSEIISQNMAKGGEVDPMIPGKKILAIFGFCDIRNFTDATEILQQDVMVFVNEIAEIVHGTVDFFSGAANKNIGDAFLLVWKFPQEDIEYDDEGQPQLKDTESVKGFADMALVSFLKIIAKVNRSLKLDKYRKHAGLNARMPNYSVKMGFGLHCGWAIEGAIGSEYKIDASYLSPNVNMAARLEAATKQFGVPLLVSGKLKDLLTDGMKEHVRVIDNVTVKGSNQPIEMCTVDLNLHKLKVNKAEKDFSKLSRMDKKRERLRNRHKRDRLREKVTTGDFRVTTYFVTDRDLKMMREPFNAEFYEKWKEGYDNYIAGDWERAKEYFEDTISMIPGHVDGPSNTLLEVIAENGGKAPLDWRGYRELTEK